MSEYSDKLLLIDIVAKAVEPCLLSDASDIADREAFAEALISELARSGYRLVKS